MVVKRVNIHDAKTNLSRYLAELKPGEVLVLCNRNRPVAELRTLKKKRLVIPGSAWRKANLRLPIRSSSPCPMSC